MDQRLPASHALGVAVHAERLGGHAARGLVSLVARRRGRHRHKGARVRRIDGDRVDRERLAGGDLLRDGEVLRTRGGGRCAGGARGC